MKRRSPSITFSFSPQNFLLELTFMTKMNPGEGGEPRGLKIAKVPQRVIFQLNSQRNLRVVTDKSVFCYSGVYLPRPRFGRKLSPHTTKENKSSQKRFPTILPRLIIPKSLAERKPHPGEALVLA